MTRPTLAPCTLLAALSLWLAGCAPGEAPPAPPPEVAVVTVHSGDLPLQRTMVGRLAASRIAEVRARVTGIVEARTYEEGSEVREGDVLFRIDPAPLQAALDEARAALAQAEATAENARLLAERTRALADRGVTSRQALDDAEATMRSTRAAVARARASVETARLNLSYTTVTAPIAGQAGRALVTEGALVSQSAATPLTTIEQLDPLYVDFSQPMDAVAAWRRARDNGTVNVAAGERLAVHVSLSDGSAYPEPGTLDFTDMRVDPATGSVSLRATLPNAGRQLLPGMFVSITLDAGILHDVIPVPQAALLRDAAGAYVLVLDDSDTVHRADVETRGAQDGNWIIGAGLQSGQRVIVSGLQRVNPGATATPVAWTDAAVGSGRAAD